MNPANIKIVKLEGTARQRGLAYGEECKSWIAESIGRWKTDLGKGVKMDPDAYIGRFLGDTRFLPTVERWTPDLLVELRALAQGAGQTFETMLAYHLNDEQWWHQRDLQLGIVTPVGDHCSSMGVQRQGDLPPMIAQNLDVPWVYDGTQVVLHIKYADSPLEILSYAFVGTLAVNGVNNMGVAQVQNTLLQLDHNPGGLPVSFFSRAILEQTSLRDAVKFVRTVPHASGQNYILGGPDGVVDLECSGKHAVEFLPYAGASKVYHTNHPLVNDDIEQFKAALEQLPVEQRKVVEAGLNTRTRYETVKRRMEAANPITVDAMKEALCSHDSPDGNVCAHNERGFTSGSMVMELSDKPAMHISFGPPCMNEYKKLTF